MYLRSVLLILLFKHECHFYNCKPSDAISMTKVDATLSVVHFIRKNCYFAFIRGFMESSYCTKSCIYGLVFSLSH